MHLNNKRILLTGACGFIGQEMTRQIISRQPADFITIDKMSYMSSDEFHSANGIPVYKIDICSDAAAKLIGEFKPDIVINMAAESSVDVSIVNPDIFLESNVRGVTNLMSAVLKLEAVPLFVQISTDEIYGDKLSGWSVEDDPRMASSPYSASKAAAELFVEAYGRTYNLPYLMTRSSNNYGPYQHHEKLIPRIIQNILAGKKIPVYGNGLMERDWIISSENCYGIISIIEHYAKNDVYNVGGNKTTTNIEIIRRICKIMNVDEHDFIEFVEDRKGHDKRYAISCDKIKNHTGWTPKTSLDNGLKLTVEWYRAKHG